MILPLLTITAVVLVPGQVVPVLTTIHAPSKLLAPPPRRDVDRRGSSTSGLLRRADRSGSAEREPESDLSSLPMLPPALPDCARAADGVTMRASNTATSDMPMRSRRVLCIITWCPNTGLILAA